MRIFDQDVIQVGREKFVVSFSDSLAPPGQEVDENIYLYRRENWMAGGEDGPDAILEKGFWDREGEYYVNSQKSHIRSFWGKLKRLGPVGRIWPGGEEKNDAS